MGVGQYRKIGLCVGSFDPVTNGHLWVFTQAANLFDEIIIVVGKNPGKKYTYPVEDRMNLIKDATKHLGQVQVVDIGISLLAEFAKTLDGIPYIVKGVRSAIDYEYERPQRHINSELYPGLETIFMVPPKHLEEVSSSFVKSFIGYETWEHQIKKYLPENVYEYVLNTYNKENK
jgi:pantetheine-phosphate adenylyltransferase